MARGSVENVSIYVLTDPRDGEIRYVGMTSGTLAARLRGHLQEAVGAMRRARWIQKLRRMGFVPMIELVQTVPEAFWREAEIYWIGFFKASGCDLVNSTAGGEGILGYRFSPEQRAAMHAVDERRTPEEKAAISARLSAARLGKPLSLEHRQSIRRATKGLPRTLNQQRNAESRRGVPLTAEVKEKLAAAKRGTTASDATRRLLSAQRRGRTLSPEHRAAISAGNMGRTPSAETREKLRQANLGKTYSVETRAKVSAAQIGRTHTQESKDKRSVALTGRKNGPLSPEHRAKISVAGKGRVVTKVTREKLSLARAGYRHSPETRAAISAGKRRAAQLRAEAANVTTALNAS